MIDPHIRDFATDRQREIIDAVIAHGSNRKAAKALGINATTVDKRVKEAKRRAARAGYSPDHGMTHTVPEGFHARGVSTLYDADGNIRQQWVKSQRDREYEHEALVDAMQTIAEPFRGKSGLVKAPSSTHEDLLTVYPMGDPHLGLLSWPLETGEDFNLDIAERTLVDAVDKLVGLAPPSKRALIVNLGDFFHTDNAQNRTLRSGNALDCDSRWSKILSVGVRAMRRCIDKALEKHGEVRVVCEIGNHDDHSAIMLAICLENYYANNPRVSVDTSPAMFHWYRFGKAFIGITHGDKVKHDQLPNIMATDRPKDWGETEHRYWYVGHVHHDTAKEYRGCTVETFRTLAARDAWHAAYGYRAGRDMKADVIHREHGRILRHTVGISMLNGEAA